MPSTSMSRHNFSMPSVLFPATRSTSDLPGTTRLVYTSAYAATETNLSLEQSFAAMGLSDNPGPVHTSMTALPTQEDYNDTSGRRRNRLSRSSVTSHDKHKGKGLKNLWTKLEKKIRTPFHGLGKRKGSQSNNGGTTLVIGAPTDFQHLSGYADLEAMNVIPVRNTTAEVNQLGVSPAPARPSTAPGPNSANNDRPPMVIGAPTNLRRVAGGLEALKALRPIAEEPSSPSRIAPLNSAVHDTKQTRRNVEVSAPTNLKHVGGAEWLINQSLQNGQITADEAKAFLAQAGVAPKNDGPPQLPAIEGLKLNLTNDRRASAATYKSADDRESVWTDIVE